MGSDNLPPKVKRNDSEFTKKKSACYYGGKRFYKIATIVEVHECLDGTAEIKILLNSAGPLKVESKESYAEVVAKIEEALK